MTSISTDELPPRKTAGVSYRAPANKKDVYKKNGDALARVAKALGDAEDTEDLEGNKRVNVIVAAAAIAMKNLVLHMTEAKEGCHCGFTGQGFNLSDLMMCNDEPYCYGAAPSEDCAKGGAKDEKEPLSLDRLVK